MATGTPFLWRGHSSLLVSLPRAVLVVDALRQRGYTVIGMDGFTVESHGIVQRLDLIFDPGQAEVHPDDAVAILQRWPADVWVEFVLDDR